MPRPRRTPGNPTRTRAVADCPTCGKKCFVTRKAARSAGRRLYPSEHLTAYQCGTYFHFGHPARAIIAGDATRSEVYGVVV